MQVQERRIYSTAHSSLMYKALLDNVEGLEEMIQDPQEKRKVQKLFGQLFQNLYNAYWVQVLRYSPAQINTTQQFIRAIALPPSTIESVKSIFDAAYLVTNQMYNQLRDELFFKPQDNGCQTGQPKENGCLTGQAEDEKKEEEPNFLV